MEIDKPNHSKNHIKKSYNIFFARAAKGKFEPSRDRGR